MKIRNGFVSNSSSSSFICGMKNFDGRSKRVEIDFLEDRLKDLISGVKSGWSDEDEVQACKEEIARWEKLAEERDLYIFDLSFEYGSEDILDNMKKKIPTFEVLECDE